MASFMLAPILVPERNNCFVIVVSFLVFEKIISCFQIKINAFRQREKSYLFFSLFSIISSLEKLRGIVKREKYKKKSRSLAQLPIRKLGSFIRLWRVILLRSDIRLMPSDICYASFGRRIKYH